MVSASASKRPLQVARANSRGGTQGEAPSQPGGGAAKSSGSAAATGALGSAVSVSATAECCAGGAAGLGWLGGGDALAHPTRNPIKPSEPSGRDILPLSAIFARHQVRSATWRRPLALRWDPLGPSPTKSEKARARLQSIERR